MTDLVGDLKYAVRTLLKSPAFCTVALVSLTLGIAANTAIFTLTDQLLLRLLPVRDPRQLVLLSPKGANYGNNTGRDSFSYLMYTDIRDKNQVFSGSFCRWQTELSFAADGRTEHASAELVSGNYFPVLGVGAALGPVFTANDDQVQGANPYVVPSYGFWQAQFAGDRGLIGKIRMTLGAKGGSVVWMLMTEILVLAAAGIASGVPGAWMLGKLVESQLHGVHGRDIATIAGAAVLIAMVAGLAGFGPGRRAVRIQPMEALRWE